MNNGRNEQWPAANFLVISMEDPIGGRGALGYFPERLLDLTAGRPRPTGRQAQSSR